MKVRRRSHDQQGSSVTMPARFVPWYLSLGMVCFLSVAVTATTDVILTETWCYGETSLPHSIACRNGNVLWIQSVITNVHTSYRHRFCQDPSPSQSDCPLSEDTEYYRRVCNAKNECIFLFKRKPQNTCNEAQNGPLYVHMEYACVAATDLSDIEYPVVQPLLSDDVTAASGTVWLTSSSYPSEWLQIQDTSCAITMHHKGMVMVSIRDLSVVTNQGQTGVSGSSRCLYALSLGHNETSMCAKPGLHTLPVLLVPPGGGRGELLVSFSVSQHPAVSDVYGRFWITVTGYRGNSTQTQSLTVSCTNLVTPPAASTKLDSVNIPMGAMILPIVCIVVFSILLIIGIILLVWFLLRRRKQKSIENPEEDEDTNSNRPDWFVRLKGTRKPKEGDKSSEPQPHSKETDALNHEPQPNHTTPKSNWLTHLKDSVRRKPVERAEEEEDSVHLTQNDESTPDTKPDKPKRTYAWFDTLMKRRQEEDNDKEDNKDDDKDDDTVDDKDDDKDDDKKDGKDENVELESEPKDKPDSKKPNWFTRLSKKRKVEKMEGEDGTANDETKLSPEEDEQPNKPNWFVKFKNKARRKPTSTNDKNPDTVTNPLEENNESREDENLNKPEFHRTTAV